jgi:hypothetical protein
MRNYPPAVTRLPPSTDGGDRHDVHDGTKNPRSHRNRTNKGEPTHQNTDAGL